MSEQEPIQESQQEAQKNNELPQGVLLNEGAPVAEYSNDNEQVKGKLAEFGETDLEQFIAKVGSNQVYTRQVVRKLLGLDANKPFVVGNRKPSPQEHNIVGSLDHSTYPPTIKEDAIKTPSGGAVQPADVAEEGAA